MQFKELKQNYPVYILDKQSMEFRQGKAVAVSFPRMDVAAGAGRAQTVVDVTVEEGGKTATYAIPESLSVTYAGSLVLSTDRDGLAREVEAMKSEAEQAVASVDRHREVAAKASALLAELSPAYRERAEADERFGRLEKSVADMGATLERMMEEFRRCSQSSQ